MVDIHSHIIFDVDDGCSNIEESINVIKKLKNLGFDSIILTPHYIKASEYTVENKEKKEKFNILKEELAKNNIDVNLYLGNEIYMNDEIDELVLSKKAYTMNNSRYILIEFSLYNEIKNIEDYLYELKLKGYIPIIAHPERYTYFQKDYSKVDELYESGVLFQCNYASIIGSYGKDAAKLITYILKKGMVSFMATDVHKEKSSLYDNFNKITKKIKSIVGEEEFINITHNNALKVINDEIIEY